MRAQHHHSWELVSEPIKDENRIWCCRLCGLFRASATIRNKRKDGTPKICTSFSTEYSTPGGEVIAMNPKPVPPCDRELYAGR